MQYTKKSDDICINKNTHVNINIVTNHDYQYYSSTGALVMIAANIVLFFIINLMQYMIHIFTYV